MVYCLEYEYIIVVYTLYIFLDLKIYLKKPILFQSYKERQCMFEALIKNFSYPFPCPFFAQQKCRMFLGDGTFECVLVGFASV